MKMRNDFQAIACLAALVVVGLGLGLAPAPARGQCATEVTAVLLVSDIYPGTDPQVTRLHLSRVPARTNPTDEELLAAVRAVYVGDQYANLYYHQHLADLGDYGLYYASPGDFGAVTIIDRGTAQIVFAGTVVWMGDGSVVVPATATHASPPVPGPPASPPASLEVFASAEWGSGWGTPEALAQSALACAAQTDFLRGMANCGPYSVVAYTYTPTVGATDPYAAMEVLIIRGTVDDTWMPVASEGRSWGGVKTLYR